MGKENNKKESDNISETSEEIEEWQIIEPPEEKPPEQPQTIIKRQKEPEEQDLSKCQYCGSENIYWDDNLGVFACGSCRRIYRLVEG